MIFNQKQINNFWDKVKKTDTCWLWTGHTNGGYGKVNINSVVYSAHRISCILAGEDIPPSTHEKGATGQIIMHICDNRKCVNPAHLCVSTQKENMNDAKKKGRKWYGETTGENNGRAKLSEGTVRSLKKIFKDGIKVDMYGLAEVLDINVTQLYAIKSNKSWRHVNP